MKKLIYASDPDGTGYDSLEVEAEGNIVEFTVDNPWYGDTEAGFGARLSMSLQYEEVVELRDGLTDWIKQYKKVKK